MQLAIFGSIIETKEIDALVLERMGETMSRARIALALALLLAAGRDAGAGVPLVSPPGGGGISIGFTGRRISGSITIGNFHSPYYTPYFAPPAFYGPAYPGVTILGPPPPLTVVIPVRVIAPALPPAEPERAAVIRDEDFPDKIVIRPRPPQPVQPVKREEPPLAEPPLRPLPGQAAGEFRPIQPDDRARVQPERPAAPLLPDQPEKDPVAESARQVGLGKMAFAAKEYGRAERRFHRAAQVAPKEPLPHFLLAQARMAQGKYREATAAIHDGLRLFPDWPSIPYKVRDLYQEHPAEFDLHLKRLDEALRRHPDDPALLFLYAYHLWFDGRQAEARPLFQRAARLVTAPFFIDLFLLGQPAAPVARN